MRDTGELFIPRDVLGALGIMRGVVDFRALEGQRQDEVPVETADTARRAGASGDGGTLEKLGPAFPLITFSHPGGKRANHDARN